MADDTGEGLAATVDRLRAELEDMRRAMRRRGVIEQAKGLLVERMSCTPEEAFDHLAQLSQHTNMKLTEVAAGLLGIAAAPDLAVPAGEADADGADAGEAAGRYHMASSALTTARDADGVARLLVDEGVGWMGADAVALAALEPDGALRLAGTHGVAAQLVSEWQRIPPRSDVAMMRAVRAGAATWVREDEGTTIVPGRQVLALPLEHRGRVVGAMAVGWPGPADREPAERYVRALARPVASRLLAVLERARRDAPGTTAPPAPGGDEWFRAVLDAMLDPVVILSSIREGDGEITDFRVEHANAATVDIAGRTGADIVGRRVTELYPGMVLSGVLRRLAEVAATGVPYRGGAEQFIEVVRGALRTSTMTLHATRFLDGVLVSWHAHDAEELSGAQLAQARSLAGIGTWRWEPGGGPMVWSPEVYRVLGLPPEKGPLTLRQAEGLVLPEDAEAVRVLAAELMRERREVSLEFRVRRPRGDVRAVRVGASPVVDTVRGTVLMVRGVVQDVTAWRRGEQALGAAREQLAEGRRRAEAERRVLVGLQNALLDVSALPRAEGARVVARYVPAGEAAQVGGDWFDALGLPDGHTLMTVGDVAGHGVKAAAGMALIRNALRGMAYTGAPPARVLTWLNQMVCDLGRERLATVVCARLDPRSRTLTWAQAGHPPPLLVRGRDVRVLRAPEGVVLGASAAAEFAEATERLEAGDVLLAFTDGLIERRGGDLERGLGRLAEVVRERTGADAEALVAHVMRRLGRPNPDDDTTLVGVRIA